MSSIYFSLNNRHLLIHHVIFFKSFYLFALINFFDGTVPITTGGKREEDGDSYPCKNGFLIYIISIASPHGLIMSVTNDSVSILPMCLC